MSEVDAYNKGVSDAAKILGTMPYGNLTIDPPETVTTFWDKESLKMIKRDILRLKKKKEQ